MEPRLSNLAREEVLVQAWKKAHKWVRLHNWVEDVLELDLSAVNLRKLVDDWSTTIRGSSPLVPEPLRLIYAPKSSEWGFRKQKWRPLAKSSVRQLRPLAKVSMRDQTIAMAFLICMADPVETALGNPKGDYRTARARGMVSYGNRLFCDDVGDQLRFRWGNAGTYRKYYQDFRNFIERPSRVIGEYFGDDENWAEVRTDLSQFYDRVKGPELVKKARSIVVDESDSEFFDAMEQFFSWPWAKEDTRRVKRYADSCDPRLDDFGTVGLPQGLVASGFFANLFLHDFDRAVWKLCESGLEYYSWQIRDYSRYVDDMRFVLDLEDCPSDTDVKTEFLDVLQRLLDQHAPGQYLNKGKTSVIYGGKPSALVPVADTMKIIQGNISGPLDTAGALQTLGMIEGLLTTKGDAETDLQGQDINLRSLLSPQLEVKEETVARFSAYNWRKTFRSLRPLCEDDDDDQTTISRVFLDRRAAMFASQLVRKWVKDPSNVRLLRIAMDVTPSPTLLEAVIGLLLQHLDSTKTNSTERQVCFYVASELFRAGSTETGLVREDQLPTHSGADLALYRSILAAFADRLIREISNAPWYVRQQAILFLCVQLRQDAVTRPSRYPRHMELYYSLHDLLRDELPRRLGMYDTVGLVLVLAQITRDERRAASLILKILARASPADAHRALSLILLDHQPIAEAVWDVADDDARATWRSLYHNLGYLAAKSFPTDLSEVQQPTWYSLLDVVGSVANPFRQEFAAIALLRGLINARAVETLGVLTPTRILVRCEDWSRLNTPKAAIPGFLEVQITPARSAARITIGVAT
jgi:hypothetical protein